jgi:acyl carrier protein
MCEGKEQMEYGITDTIRRFLTERAWLTDSTEVSESDSLLEKGVLDSLAMIELVSFIEQTFQVRIHDEELMPENFDSLAAMEAFITSKRNGV